MQITVYSKKFCIYCDRLKDLLEDYDLLSNVTEHDIQVYKDTIAIPNEYVTAPRVFINGTLIGGFDETRTWFRQNII